MPDKLQLLTINDFTPGIRHKTLGGGASSRSPLGAADPAATFRCRVLPDGALGPLPALASTKTYNPPGAPEDETFRISGFHVTGPMQDSPYDSVFSGDDNVEVHVAFEFFESGDVHKWYWFRFQAWNAMAVDTIRNLTVDDNGFTPENHWYRPTSFVDARMHATDPTALGDIFVVAGWHPDNMQALENVWSVYPDPDVPNSTGYADIFDKNEVTLMVQHQGRVISVDNHVFQHGGSGFWIINDQLIWTQVNLPILLGTDPDIESVGVFTQGPVSGYGAVVSASAQELLFIKHRGGGTIISGDIDDPTIMSLPGVASTRGATTIAVYTPLGVVYGVKNGGIHAWGGGDTSQKLSMFLEDDFWQIKPDDWQGFDGKFDVFESMILCPNNWIYDITSQSWWRIEDPATYQIFQWSVSPQSDKFYGAPITITTDGGPLWYRFDANEVSDSYTWRSQYLAPTIDRVVEVREISIRALSSTGESTITVTLTNDEGDEPVSEEFDITSTTIPKLLRKPTAFQGTGIKVAIEASSLDGAAAPILYEINLGYQMAQNVAYT